MENDSGNGGEAVPNGNGKAEQVLERGLGQVQEILEHNQLLIEEIEQNQESRKVGGLTRNMALFRELNSNMARAADLYADLSSTLCKSIAKDYPYAAKAADAANGYNKRSRPPQ